MLPTVLPLSCQTVPMPGVPRQPGPLYPLGAWPGGQREAELRFRGQERWDAGGIGRRFAKPKSEDASGGIAKIFKEDRVFSSPSKATDTSCAAVSMRNVMPERVASGFN